MNSIMRAAVAVMAMALLTGFICGVANASQTTEGQVVSVKDWVLTVGTASNESIAFSPYWVREGTSSMPGRPARTILPALEAGETVRVTWTLDEREHRNRIDNIEVISPREGTTKAVVGRRAANELVVRVPEKPGTVTMNTKFVQVEGKWVPDPEVSRRILSFKEGAKVTIDWAWDKEGRKRIVAITEGW